MGVDYVSPGILRIRIEGDSLVRLEAMSRREGQTPAQAATTLIEEGLRMEANPGIVFRSGPAGRRPGLAGGPDIWEIARLFEGRPQDNQETFQWVAGELNLRLEQVERAARYYAEYRAEIDAWLRTLDEEAEREEAAWLGKHALNGT